MAVLLAQHPLLFPASKLARMMTEFFPAFSWRAGDEDRPGAEAADFDRPQMIMGRSEGNVVMFSIEHRHGTYAPANGHLPPPHAVHLVIGRPSTDDDALARAVVLVAATMLAMDGDTGAHVQLDPGEPWLDATDMRSLAKTLGNDPTLSGRGRYGRPEPYDGGVSAAARDDAAKASGNLLGNFTLLLDDDVHIDWAKIDHAMNVIDPEGGWSSVAVPQGLGFITGRTKIMLIWSPEPYDRAEIEDAYGRSVWFSGDRARVARHRRYINIAIEAPDDFAAKAATAKAVTILIGLIAQQPQVAAVLNEMVSTIFSPQMVHRLVGILHSNEVPIQLWTWTAPDSMTDGNVSLTTGGLESFLGYEVEVWNAPFPSAVVGEKMSAVLRYLLINGPVIAHGDTIGASSDDQSIRCFFGTSRANRPELIKAMFVEFDIDRPRRPIKDEPAPSAPRPTPAPAMAGGFGRRATGGFGRKGL